MKVRTINELQDKLDNEIQWRKRELLDYKFVVEKNKTNSSIVPLIRGGIALGYAHWEGFVKNSASIYVSYISTKKIPLDKMKLNFLALTYMKKINKGNNIEECISLMQEVLSSNQKTCKIYDKDIIDTRSNLKLHVLNDILTSLGFEKHFFSSKESFIDKKLVEPRNDIAHGTYRDVDYEDFKIVHENVIPLMEYFKTLIENSVSQEDYKK